MERIAGTRQRASYRLVIWVQPDVRDLPVPARLPAWKTRRGIEVARCYFDNASIAVP